MARERHAALLLRSCLMLGFSASAVLQGAGSSASSASPSTTPPATFRQYCFGCHGKTTAMGGINLEQLTSQSSVGNSFAHWKKVAAALEQKQMPPAKMPQPTEAERSQTVTWIRAKLNDFAQKNAGDPGPVTMRRLTSGEYSYTVQDLTGLDLKIERDFVSDSVGGEGFTNFGDVQFMHDADLERYLETAKKIAEHAVVGSGPLQFFDATGKSGFELSAISRIRKIYETNGFRSNSGEGGAPFGLERYTNGFYVCWQYLHRKELGEPNVTLEAIAARDGVSRRFARHLWAVLQQPSATYPVSEIVAKWRALPGPAGTDKAKNEKAGRAGADTLMHATVDWPRWLFAAGALAAGGQGDERALTLNDAALQPDASHSFKYPLRGRLKKSVRVYFTLIPLNPHGQDKPLVVWHNAMVEMRGKEKGAPLIQKSLKSLLDADTVARLNFGKRSDGGEIDPDDFAMPSDGTVYVDIPTDGSVTGLGTLNVEARIGAKSAGDAIIRCTMADGPQGASGIPAWSLLGDPNTAGFRAWKSGVLEFAAQLPQNSQAEPAPADKDPIPALFAPSIVKNPERDQFHNTVKYFRNDSFLMEHVLDDATRLQLNQAWNDLLSSFGYHNALLHFADQKYQLNLKNKSIADLNISEIQAMPAEPRKWVHAWRVEYDAVQKAERDARPGHVEDCLRFASMAWRRPLTEAEKTKLRTLYKQFRTGPELDHEKAIEMVLTRILVDPAFLYRVETSSERTSNKSINDWELASRMSYFLWSSMPDEELRRVAAAGELDNPQQLDLQVKRMMADPKARRFATEFFGQWLGFYRFDQYRGVDTGRFPEFTEEVKSDMYDEAVSFFEHIVRKDRPVREILFADYTFLTKALAKHYGVKRDVKATADPEMVENAHEFQRGGLLRLGAVLTGTSAPLRTSPVKRGDWVLRRILGTPTPPPPPNAGSIPSDDKSFGGLTVREKLAAHQRNPTCANCHSRIDPMGFPLEHYDSVGRWREKYNDGKLIQDSSTTRENTEIEGVDGLLNYLKSKDDQVMRTLSNKLVGYALGRTVLGSDELLIDHLSKADEKATFSTMAAEIVKSRQFRYRREHEETPQMPKSQIAVVKPSSKPDQKLQTEKRGGL